MNLDEFWVIFVVLYMLNENDLYCFSFLFLFFNTQFNLLIEKFVNDSSLVTCRYSKMELKIPYK